MSAKTRRRKRRRTKPCPTQDYIRVYWPEIEDVSECAEFVLSEAAEGPIDELCQLWVETQAAA